MATRRGGTGKTGGGAAAAATGAAETVTAPAAKPLATRPSAVGVQQRQRFLDALTETSNVSAAAEAAAIAVTTLYRMRDADAGFAAEWRRALEIGYELIEGNLLAAARGAKSDIDTNLARQMLQQRDARGGKAAGTAATAGMQVKKVSLADVEAEVLRLLGVGRKA